MDELLAGSLLFFVVKFVAGATITALAIPVLWHAWRLLKTLRRVIGIARGCEHCGRLVFSPKARFCGTCGRTLGKAA